MTFIATSRFTILRAEQTVSYTGDVEDGPPRIIAERVAASVMDTSRRVFDPSSSQTGVVQYVVGRFRPGTDLKTGDLVRDEKTKVTYVVEDVNVSTSGIHKPDVVASLSRTE